MIGRKSLMEEIKGLEITVGGKDVFPKEAKEVVLKIIDGQPEPDGWIPVSERLPTMKECHRNDNRFISTDGNRTLETIFDYGDNKFGFCDGLKFIEFESITAWKNMPEPYREE